MSKAPFTTDDLFLHRTLSTLSSGPAQQWLVFPVKRALRDADGYETTLWGLRPAQGGQPRALTTPVFDASHPRLRPDGSCVAFLSSRDKGGLQVHLLPLDGGEATPLVRKGDEALSSLEAWSPDGKRLMATASVDCVEDGEDKGGSAGRPAQVATYLPYKSDGNGITVGYRMHLLAIDVDSGESTALTKGDFDVQSGDWSPDGRRLAYVRKGEGRLRHRYALWVAGADGDNARALVERLASIQDFAWSPDGRRIAIAGTEIEGDSRVGLWLVEVDSGTLRQLVDEDFELSTSSTLHWHPDGVRLAVIADLRGQHRIAVVEVDAGSYETLACGLRSVEALGQCGDRLVYVDMGMRRLNEVSSCGWDGSHRHRHTRFNDWFLARPLPRVRKRCFEVPDGNGGTERIEAWVLLPAKDGDQGPDGPYPLLVDMHGGPHSMVLTDYTAHTYWYLLLSKGWAIVAPNAVGSTSYGKAFAERLIGRWGELDLPQYLFVVRTLQEEGLADERLACAGKSYGGFLSAWAIGHTDLFKAAAVAAPVANILSHMGTSDSGYYVTPFAMGAGPDEAPELYSRLSPVTYCHNVRAATLILQGENDGRCPRGQSEELFAHLMRCNQAKAELVVYPESSHAEAESGRPSNRVDYHSRLAEWLDAHATRRDA